MRPILRQNTAVIHVDVFQEVAAHQVVLVSYSVGFHVVRSQQKARGFNSAATNHIVARLGRSFFPRQSFELDAIDRRAFDW